MSNEVYRLSRKERFWVMFFMIVMVLVWALPIYTVVVNSLKVNGAKNYSYVFSNKINGVPFLNYFLNSAVNGIGSSLLLLVVCVTSGFAFSKINFRGRVTAFSLTVMCLAISGPVLIVPFFYILKTLKLYNTHIGVFLCEAIITVPFGVLMIKNFFDGLPDSLMEAAAIEGASVYTSFKAIYMPLAVPAIVNLGVLQFMWSLQDFLFPLMFLTNQKLFTSTVAVYSFRGAYGMSPQDIGRYNAALVLISVPTILLFIFAQRYIIGGITAGAIKE